jgi:Na+-transporting NADH:ubiquinone oxidoreductase subunit NqrD
MKESVIDILIYATPILLAVLGFIGALAVNALIKMAKDLTEIKIAVKEVATKHDEVEKRVERLEEILYK